MRRYALLTLIILLGTPLVAQDGTGGSSSESAGDSFSGQTDDDSLFAIDDFDSLFEEDEIIESEPESTTGTAPQDDLLVSEGVRWGGRVSGSVAADWNYRDVWSPRDEWFRADSTTLTPTVGGALFFDARPSSEFRAYGKFDFDTTTNGGLFGVDLATTAINTGALPAGWTAETNDDGDTEIRDQNGILIATLDGGGGGTGDNTGSAPGLEIAVRELFADYTWRDTLFFRYGKHTIQWGTGYFFSPADVLNLSAVDAEDPTAEREGPLSLRLTYPFGITGNAYFYLITNTGAEPLDVAVAPKVEFALGPGELGVGAYYQRSLAPRLILLYSGSIGEVDVFGEGVLLWGSDRTFVRPSRDQSAATADPEDDLDLVLDTYSVSSGLFALGTAGVRYLRDFENGPSVIAIGQYYFNGEGYAYTPGLLPAAARLLLNPGENGLTIDNPNDQPEGYEDPPALAVGDLANFGRHYLAGTVALSGLFVDELTVSLFGLWNLSDMSAILGPSVSVSFLDRFSASIAARFTLGPSDGEYTDPAAVFAGDTPAPTLGLTLSVSMPGGSF
jgi:hypothetical protein